MLNSVWVDLIFAAIGPPQSQEKSWAQVSHSGILLQAPSKFFLGLKPYQVLHLPHSNEYQHSIVWWFVQWIPSLSVAFGTSKEANKGVPSREGLWTRSLRCALVMNLWKKIRNHFRKRSTHPVKGALCGRWIFNLLFTLPYVHRISFWRACDNLATTHRSDSLTVVSFEYEE